MDPRFGFLTIDDLIQLDNDEAPSKSYLMKEWKFTNLIYDLAKKNDLTSNDIAVQLKHIDPASTFNGAAEKIYTVLAYERLLNDPRLVGIIDKINPAHIDKDTLKTLPSFTLLDAAIAAIVDPATDKATSQTQMNALGIMDANDQNVIYSEVQYKELKNNPRLAQNPKLQTVIQTQLTVVIALANLSKAEIEDAVAVIVDATKSSAESIGSMNRLGITDATEQKEIYGEVQQLELINNNANVQAYVVLKAAIGQPAVATALTGLENTAINDAITAIVNPATTIADSQTRMKILGITDPATQQNIYAEVQHRALINSLRPLPNEILKRAILNPAVIGAISMLNYDDIYTAVDAITDPNTPNATSKDNINRLGIMDAGWQNAIIGETQLLHFIRGINRTNPALVNLLKHEKGNVVSHLGLNEFAHNETLITAVIDQNTNKADLDVPIAALGLDPDTSRNIVFAENQFNRIFQMNPQLRDLLIEPNPRGGVQPRMGMLHILASKSTIREVNALVSAVQNQNVNKRAVKLEMDNLGLDTTVDANVNKVFATNQLNRILDGINAAESPALHATLTRDFNIIRDTLAAHATIVNPNANQDTVIALFNAVKGANTFREAKTALDVVGIATQAEQATIFAEIQYHRLLERSDIKSMPALQDVLKNSKDALINKWSNELTGNPDQQLLPTKQAISDLRDTLVDSTTNLATAQTNIRATFDANFLALPGQPEFEELRGQARYDKFSEENRALLNEIPSLKRSIEAEKDNLITYGQTHELPTPQQMVTLRNTLSQLKKDPANPAQYTTDANNAINAAFGGVAVGNLPDAVAVDALVKETEKSKQVEEKIAYIADRVKQYDAFAELTRTMKTIDNNSYGEASRLIQTHINQFDQSFVGNRQLLEKLKLYQGLLATLSTDPNYIAEDLKKLQATKEADLKRLYTLQDEIRKHVDDVNKKIIDINKNKTYADRDTLGNYEFLAERQRAKAEKVIGSLSPSDLAKRDEITALVNQMKDPLLLAQGQLVKEGKGTDTPHYQKIEECLAILDETKQIIQNAPRTVTEINCFSQEFFVGNNTTDADKAVLNAKVDEYKAKFGIVGGDSGIAIIATADAGIKKDVFGLNQTRITLNQAATRDGNSTGIVAIQQYDAKNQLSTTLEYTKDEIEKLSRQELVKLAARIVEDHYAPLVNKKIRMELKDMSPRLAEAIYTYCELRPEVAYPKPALINTTLPERSFWNSRESYKKDFAKILDENKDQIFLSSHAAPLGAQSKDIKKAVDAVIGTKPSHTGPGMKR